MLINSRRYKPFLRSDFRKTCAYCERSEHYLGGEDVFEVDHFRPRSRFPWLDLVYVNLYYACRCCNGHKHDTWPSDSLQATGLRFADPCEEDPYVHHLRETEDGGVTGTTRCGIYTLTHLRLDRPDLKRWRRLRAQAAQDLPVFSDILRSLEHRMTQARPREHDELGTQIAALRRHIEEAKLRFGIA